MRIKQSFCIPILENNSDYGRDELCKQLACIGYRAIEFWQRGQDFLDLVETAKRHGLSIVSMCGHGTLTDGLNKYENHDRIESELLESIDLAAQHHIPGLICFSGNRNDGQSDLEGMMACAQGLRRVNKYAEEKSINLNIELLNSKVTHPGYQADHTDWGLALCEMVDSPRVKLLYDIYHMQIMEGDLIRNIRKAINRIGHFHTAGNPGRGDMDNDQELNYAGICRAIAATKYDLYLGHEFTPKADVLDAARDAFVLCDQG